MHPGHKPRDFVEVYGTSSTHVPQKILDVLLAPEGIEATIHDRANGMFPTAGEPGGYFVAVSGDQAERARQIIAEALRNGFLDPGEGELITRRS